MIPVTAGILIVLLKFPRIVCSTDYLLVNGVVKKYSQSLSDEPEHGVRWLVSNNNTRIGL